MGINDAQLTVEIVAETSKFQEGTTQATKTINDFSNQGTKAVTQLHNAQKTWTADMAKGQAKGQLRLIAMEMGNLAGAGGVAGRAMGSLMAVMGSGGLVGVLALVATGIGYLIQSHKAAAEEAAKQEQTELALAAAYDKATEAQAELTAAQKDAGEQARQTRKEHFAQLVKEDTEELRRLDDALIDANEGFERLKSTVTLSAKEIKKFEDEQKTMEKNIRSREDLMEAHAHGFETLTEYLNSATAAAKELNEVIVPPDLASASKAWHDQQDQVAEYQKRLKALQVTLDEMAEQGAKEFKSQWKAAEDGFMSATSGMQGAMTDLITTMVTGAQSAQAAWEAFGKAFIAQAVEMMASMAVKAIFKILGTALLGPGFGAVSTVLGLAEGNARVTKPTLAVIGEGNEPENVLTDSQLAAASGGGIQVGSISLSYNGPGTENDRQRFVTQSVQDFLKMVARAQSRTGRRTAMGAA